MRDERASGDNVPVETRERPRWWRHVLDLDGRPDEDHPDRRGLRDTPGPRGDGPSRPSRRALATDVAVAIVLTFIAMAVSVRNPSVGLLPNQPEVIDYLRLKPAA